MNKKTACAVLLLILLTSMLSSALIGTLNVAKADNQSSDSNGDPNSWPMLGGDLSHTGYSTSTAPLTNKTLWSFQTSGQLFSSPAVVGGVVYVGSWDGNLYALNASDGDELWSYQTGSQVWSSPAIANGVLYIVSYDGDVFALNATSGSPIWINHKISFADTEAFSSPAVANGVVYLCVGTDDGGYLYALDASDGVILWSYPIGFTFSSPAVADGVVYVGSASNNSVYALDASNGAEIWNYQADGMVLSSPAVANGVVYVG